MANTTNQDEDKGRLGMMMMMMKGKTTVINKKAINNLTRNGQNNTKWKKVKIFHFFCPPFLLCDLLQLQSKWLGQWMMGMMMKSR